MSDLTPCAACGLSKCPRADGKECCSYCHHPRRTDPSPPSSLDIDDSDEQGVP